MQQDMMNELKVINHKLDVINQALAELLDRLAEMDEQDDNLLYNERDQTKPL